MINPLWQMCVCPPVSLIVCASVNVERRDQIGRKFEGLLQWSRVYLHFHNKNARLLNSEVKNEIILI